MMPILCPDCAASMPDTAAFCPACGRDMRPVMRANGTVGGLPERLAGALCYFLLPAIPFLLINPYKSNRFVRFHSFQCIGMVLATVVFVAVLRISGVLLFFIPVIGPLLVSLVSMVVTLAFVMIWIVLVVKALQGEMFKLPLIGKFAEQQALIS
jgi:uncharacterized membrane protein